MVVKPTVNELLKNAENRFALVIATSKRARQIAGGDKALTDVDEESPVTLAANEINEGKVIIHESKQTEATTEDVEKIKEVTDNKE